MRSLFALLTVAVAATGAAGASQKCVVPHTPNADDTPAITQVMSRCNVNSTVVFTSGTAYNLWSPMRWTNLTNVDINLDGSFHMSTNITDVQSKILAQFGNTTSSSPWIYIQGTNVNFKGSSSPNGGILQGFGQQWWDRGIQLLRPYWIQFNVSHGTISKVKVLKPVAQGFNIPGNNIKITDHYVDARPVGGSRDVTASFPFNTDGFNVGGQNITIDGYHGYQGDDCISIVNKAKNVVARNGYCGWSAHGLSIGSLGKNGAAHQVSDIVFDNWVMDNAVYGARFKSWTGGQGLASNITWRNLKLVNVSTPIFITQNYYTQTTGVANTTATTSTHLDHIRFENFEGYMNPNWTDGSCMTNPCWNYVEGIDATQAIIFDLYNGTATDIQVKNIHVRPYHKVYNATNVICDPVTLSTGEEKTLGFKCGDGPFVSTKIES